MIRIPTHRVPTHPGEMLVEEFMRPLSLTSAALAAAIHLPEEWIDELMQGQQDITPRVALRLAKLFRLSPDFWMNVQMRWDLYRAEQEERNELGRIQPILTTTIA